MSPAPGSVSITQLAPPNLFTCNMEASRRLHQFVDMAAQMLVSVPMAQEFYLLFFFCLGFALFRTDVVKHSLGLHSRSVKGKEISAQEGDVPSECLKANESVVLDGQECPSVPAQPCHGCDGKFEMVDLPSPATADISMSLEEQLSQVQASDAAGAQETVSNTRPSVLAGQRFQPPCPPSSGPYESDAAVVVPQQKPGPAAQKASAQVLAQQIKEYGRTGQLRLALKLWDDLMHQEAVPGEKVFTQMIDLLVSHNRLDQAVALFAEMKAVYPDKMKSHPVGVAYATVIKGFAQRKDCARALQYHDEMKKMGACIGLVVLNTLIDACCRAGDMAAAARLFREMLEAEVVPDLITYSTLIKGYCLCGQLDRAMELFTVMKRRGIKPDAIVFNSLLDGCANKEMPALCEQVMKDMVAAGVRPSVHSASILIKLYGRMHNIDAAFRVIDEMPREYGFRTNVAVYTTLMSTCTWNGRLDLAMELRLRMLKEGMWPDEKTYSTLLKGAMRSGAAEHCATLLCEALEQASCSGVSVSQLLDAELVQSALLLMQRRRQWGPEGELLLNRLRHAGLQVRAASVKAGGGSETAEQLARRRRPEQRPNAKPEMKRQLTGVPAAFPSASMASC